MSRWWRWATIWCGVLLPVSVAWAQGPQATGTPTAYKVTVKKIEFSTDGGATYTTFREADQEIDVASASAGAVAANYASGALPSGTYNRVRVTLSCTMRLRGSVAFVGTTYYTTLGGGTSTSAAALAEGAYTVPTPPCNGGVLTDVQAVSLALSGQARTVNVTFDVTGSIRLDGAPLAATLSPNTVSVTMTAE